MWILLTQGQWHRTGNRRWAHVKMPHHPLPSPIVDPAPPPEASPPQWETIKTIRGCCCFVSWSERWSLSDPNTQPWGAPHPVCHVGQVAPVGPSTPPGALLSLLLSIRDFLKVESTQWGGGGGGSRAAKIQTNKTKFSQNMRSCDRKHV